MSSGEGKCGDIISDSAIAGKRDKCAAFLTATSLL